LIEKPLGGPKSGALDVDEDGYLFFPFVAVNGMKRLGLKMHRQAIVETDVSLL